MSDSYISSTSAAGLVVPVKAATVYAAHENSLFLSGQIIPSVMRSEEHTSELQSH